MMESDTVSESLTDPVGGILKVRVTSIQKLNTGFSGGILKFQTLVSKPWDTEKKCQFQTLSIHTNCLRNDYWHLTCILYSIYKFLNELRAAQIYFIILYCTCTVYIKQSVLLVFLALINPFPPRKDQIPDISHCTNHSYCKANFYHILQLLKTNMVGHVYTVQV